MATPSPHLSDWTSKACALGALAYCLVVFWLVVGMGFMREVRFEAAQHKTKTLTSKEDTRLNHAKTVKREGLPSNKSDCRQVLARAAKTTMRTHQAHHDKYAAPPPLRRNKSGPVERPETDDEEPSLRLRRHKSEPVKSKEAVRRERQSLSKESVRLTRRARNEVKQYMRTETAAQAARAYWQHEQRKLAHLLDEGIDPHYQTYDYTANYATSISPRSPRSPHVAARCDEYAAPMNGLSRHTVSHSHTPSRASSLMSTESTGPAVSNTGTEPSPVTYNEAGRAKDFFKTLAAETKAKQGVGHRPRHR